MAAPWLFVFVVARCSTRMPDPINILYLMANPDLRIHHVSPGRRGIFAAMGQFVGLWQKSLRFATVEPLRRCLQGDDTGHILIMWHNRLFLNTAALQGIARSERKVYALVSASRDGAVLSEFLHSLGIATVRGSSSRRGALAAKELIQLIKGGHHVAITIDGPRGPCYCAQPGVAFLAQATKAPIALITAECEQAWTLKSWDRFILPKPGSRARIHCEILSAADAEQLDRDSFREKIETRLRNLTRDAHLTV